MLGEWEVYSWGEREAPNGQTRRSLLIGDRVDAVREGSSVTEFGKQLLCIEDHERYLNIMLGSCKVTVAALFQKTLRVHPCKLECGRPWPQTFLQQGTNIRLKVDTDFFGIFFRSPKEQYRDPVCNHLRPGKAVVERYKDVLERVVNMVSVLRLPLTGTSRHAWSAFRDHSRSCSKAFPGGYTPQYTSPLP